jgi:hypothetical protein
LSDLKDQWGIELANLRIEAPLVEGSLVPYIDESDSCARAVEIFCGDDLRPPPRSLKILVVTEEGKEVVVTIPNDRNGQARVTVDGAPL